MKIRLDDVDPQKHFVAITEFSPRSDGPSALIEVMLKYKLLPPTPGHGIILGADLKAHTGSMPPGKYRVTILFEKIDD